MFSVYFISDYLSAVLQTGVSFKDVPSPVLLFDCVKCFWIQDPKVCAPPPFRFLLPFYVEHLFSFPPHSPEISTQVKPYPGHTMEKNFRITPSWSSLKGILDIDFKHREVPRDR